MRGINILKEIQNSLFKKRNEIQIGDVLDFDLGRDGLTTYQYSMISKDSDIVAYIQYYKHKTGLWSLDLKEACKKYVCADTMKEAKDNNSVLLGSYGEHHEHLYLLPRTELEKFIQESETSVMKSELGANYGIIIADKENIHPYGAKFKALGNSICFYFSNIEMPVLGHDPKNKAGLHISGTETNIHMNKMPFCGNIQEVRRVGGDMKQLLEILEDNNMYFSIENFQKHSIYKA